MNSGASFEDKVFEVDNKNNYYVLKQTLYDNKIYLFANKLKDEETPSEEMAILRVDNEEDGLYVVHETDESKLKDLIVIFQQLITEDAQKEE